MKNLFLNTKQLSLLALVALPFVSCTSTDPQPAAEHVVNVTEVTQELMMSRRSIRVYQDSAIDRKTLDEILVCGVNAPNGKNQQAYEVRVVDDPALIAAMTEAVVKDNPKLGERPGMKNIFVDAPCVLFLACDTSYDMSQVDCGLLGENIILAAWSRGIGSCCLGSSARWLKDSPSAAALLKKLDFSEGYDLLYCIALGYPAEQPEAKSRTMDKVRYID